MPRKPKTKARPAPALPPGAEALLDREGVCAALGVSCRTLTELRSAGRYPAPDVRIGRLVRWTVSLHNAAVAKLAGGKGG